MRIILYLIQKEFLQIFRNRIMNILIFVVPFVQLLILANAATFEMKNIKLFIIDNDLSSVSRRLINKFDGSPFFTIFGMGFSVDEAEDYLDKNRADIILNIPQSFERTLLRENKAKIQVLINGINGVAAGLTNAYTMSVVREFNSDIISEWYDLSSMKGMKRINLTYTHWFNPELNYSSFMVPGILVLLITIIGLYLSSINTVKEKEMGTIEQINVTPIRKYQFIAGKLIPFWLIGLFELSLGLTLGKLIYDIPIIGSLWLVFGFAAIYLLAVLGVGLFISTITETQQQAMLLSLFFMFIFILMSGLFTPIESMPGWAQTLDKINPVAYFMRVMRMVLLKGSVFHTLLKEFFALLFYSTVILSLAVWRYRKTT
jgi:ABC-2 type transport system permease protein